MGIWCITSFLEVGGPEQPYQPWARKRWPSPYRRDQSSRCGQWRMFFSNLSLTVEGRCRPVDSWSILAGLRLLMIGADSLECRLCFS
jgi:hypothetical protein